MSYARLELCCKERKVTVNFNLDLRVIPRREKKINSDVLKKNINTPQFARLERKAETRAEEAKVQTKKKLNIEVEKSPTYTEKPHLRPKKPKIILKKLNILLKKQRSYY